jgi:hypothetical protein
MTMSHMHAQIECRPVWRIKTLLLCLTEAGKAEIMSYISQSIVTSDQDGPAKCVVVLSRSLQDHDANMNADRFFLTTLSVTTPRQFELCNEG